MLLIKQLRANPTLSRRLFRGAEIVESTRQHKGSEKMNNFSNFFVEIFVNFATSNFSVSADDGRVRVYRSRGRAEEAEQSCIAAFDIDDIKEDINVNKTIKS